MYSPLKMKGNTMKKYNFSLVEIIVVVGIIAVLAGLVFPAIRNAQITSKKTQCLSNQGQLMKMLITSMNTDNQQLVSGPDSQLTNGTFTRPLWVRYLYDKNRVQDLAAFRCPAMITTRKSSLAVNDSSDDNSLVNKLFTSYGVVFARGSGAMAANPQALSMTKPNYLGFDFRGTKYLTFNNSGTQVRISPNQLVLGGCSAASSSAAGSATAPKVDVGDALAKLNFAQTSNSGSMGRIADVHGGYSNLFYLDGHADSVNKDGFADNRYYPGLTSGQSGDPAALAIDKDNWFNPDDI